MSGQKQISTLFGIIIIIIVAIVLVGGVFAWQYFVPKAQQNSEFFGSSQKTNQTQTQTAGPALSEVEGWKTYTNTKYGFEIKVPVDEMISPNDVSMLESDFYMAPSYKEIFIVMQKGGCDLLVYPNIDDRFLSLIKNNAEITQLSILEHNGSRYYIGYRIVSHAVEPNECIPGLNRILPTFKFTTPADQTADWGMYTDTETGFRFKYPNKLETTIKPVSDRETLITLPIAEKGMNTNISKKTLTVTTKPQNNNSPCVGPNYYSQTSNVVINSIQFTKGRGSDGAAGHGYTYVDYMTSKNGVCITIAFTISSFNDLHIPEYTGGKPFTVYDFSKEEVIFNQIISTFEFTEGPYGY